MSVNISRLHPRLRFIARNIPRAANLAGFSARVTSGYRDPRKQAWLYNEYISGRSPYVVAPPGSSLHERGLAVDIVSTDTQKLVALLTSAGLLWAGPSDPVHFVLSGLKSQPRAKNDYVEAVGSKIPAILTALPFVGKGFSVLRDPWGTAKFEAKKLLTAVTGGWL